MGEAIIPEAKEVIMTLLIVYLAVHATGYALACAEWVRELHRTARPEF